jgi:hypothetical protein
MAGRFLYESLPAVFGEIDDEGDGTPDPDDWGYEDAELHDVMQAWVIRRVNIRPLTNVPMLDPRFLRAHPAGAGFALHLDATRGLPPAKLGLYPIVTFQYSTTTLYQFSYHIQ